MAGGAAATATAGIGGAGRAALQGLPELFGLEPSGP